MLPVFTLCIFSLQKIHLASSLHQLAPSFPERRNNYLKSLTKRRCQGGISNTPWEEEDENSRNLNRCSKCYFCKCSYSPIIKIYMSNCQYGSYTFWHIRCSPRNHVANGYSGDCISLQINTNKACKGTFFLHTSPLSFKHLCLLALKGVQYEVLTSKMHM